MIKRNPHLVNRSAIIALITALVPILYALYDKMDNSKVRNITNDMYIRELREWQSEVKPEIVQQRKKLDSLTIELVKVKTRLRKPNH